MNTPLPNDGATPEPARDTGPPECMGKYRHYPQRMWSNMEITNQIRCTTCGMTKFDGSDVWTCDHKGDKHVVLVEIPRGNDAPGNHKVLRCWACKEIFQLSEDLPLTEFDKNGAAISGVIR